MLPGSSSISPKNCTFLTSPSKQLISQLTKTAPLAARRRRVLVVQVVAVSAQSRRKAPNEKLKALALDLTAKFYEQRLAQQFAEEVVYTECGGDEEWYPPLHVQTKGKVYAIGDLHGDMAKTLMCFKMAGLMKMGEDSKPIWTGGDSIVVQLGDVLDRGDSEIKILLLLKELDRQAREQNGAVYMINGNHESLNVCSDYRYVTAGAFIESAVYYGYNSGDEFVRYNQILARDRLFKPGGEIANILADNPTVLIINDTLFAHGGVLPIHVDYGLERINQEVCSWMRGDLMDDGGYMPPPFLAMGDEGSVMWNRSYSRENINKLVRRQTSNMLKHVLDECGVKRLVVGHTPQLQGCNAEFNGMVWRLDVGMSGGVFDACATVLEISQNEDGETQTKVKQTGALNFDHVDLNHLFKLGYIFGGDDE
eukprot:TRINITY_DN671_c0_g2_i2.p1 TRINITY_DN671_c0_g2~~TRINITY_DN671_c0_g2_i2.p1  ORF type:complete len:430 (+),score=59.12 TRINITY_DN671_c0_g2_i2:22-1290(+)